MNSLGIQFILIIGSKPMSQSVSLGLTPTGKQKKTKINRRFKPEEDELLKELVRKYGENDWRRISRLMKNRSVRQCKDRWLQYLSPAANRSPWTMKEETQLLSLVKQYGKDWKVIAYSFPGRPIAQLRNKYKTVQGEISW